MDSGGWGTHAVEFAADQVIKRFPREDGGRAQREWRALTLLAAYAPGLAPIPESADLASKEPMVVMSRLAGAPLRGQLLGGQHVKALADAVNELHGAVPDAVLDRVPARPSRQRELVAQIRHWAATVRPRADAVVGQAMDAGLEWLARSDLRRDDAPPVSPVFGPGDGNLANYLWDGSKVRVVDFEDSGRSDRAFELAEITEHVSSWVEYPLDIPAFLGHFDLSTAEEARLRNCRRLLALVWLFLLALDHKNVRNPPGTAGRQAERLRSLLG